MSLRRWAAPILPLAFAMFAASSVFACGGEGETDDSTADALEGGGSLVPETAQTEAIVLANADVFAGINELHYTLLRGLFADPALNDVKVHYLTPHDFPQVLTPVRSIDGKKIAGRFSTRFEKEISKGRLKRVEADVGTNWPRDYFPMIVSAPSGNAGIRFVYENQPATGEVAQKAARSMGITVATSSLALEGGNIMIGEEGTLYTTTKILKRNASRPKAEVEKELKLALGAKDIEWLEPLPGESTGHIDIISKVLPNKRAVVGASDGVCGEDAPPSCAKRKGALDNVAKAFERRGYSVTRIMNGESGGDTRTLSYANSLLVNGTVFIPMYFDPGVADDLAMVFSGPNIPAKAIIKDCNTAHPFPGTTDLAADLVARERARCALEGVIKVAKPLGEPTSYYEYALEVARRDAEAKKAYEAFGLRVVQVPGAGMVNFGGSIHCVTMQLPK